MADAPSPFAISLFPFVAGTLSTHALRMFKAFTGLTFRGFKQWSALCAASSQIAAGQLVRTAAMDAGFSDTAHLTRTFRSSFGTTPTLATARRPDPGRELSEGRSAAASLPTQR